MICYERVVDLYLWRLMACADSSTQAMADNAGCTRVRSYSMAITKLVRIGNTLCCQHQKQQRKTRIVTQFEVGKFHIVVINNKNDCILQQNFRLEGLSKTTLTMQSPHASISQRQCIMCDLKAIGVATP